MCQKSNVLKIVIITFNKFPQRFDQQKIPQIRTHATLCCVFKPLSNCLYRFINSTNLIVIYDSIFHQYVFDLIFLMNSSNSLQRVTKSLSHPKLQGNFACNNSTILHVISLKRSIPRLLNPSQGLVNSLQSQLL